MSVTNRLPLISRTVSPRVSQCLFATKAGGGQKPKAPAEDHDVAKRDPAAPAAATPSVSEKYQCQQYYQHQEWSFYDIESQLVKLRTIPQASSKPSSGSTS